MLHNDIHVQLSWFPFFVQASVFKMWFTGFDLIWYSENSEGHLQNFFFLNLFYGSGIYLVCEFFFGECPSLLIIIFVIMMGILLLANHVWKIWVSRSCSEKECSSKLFSECSSKLFWEWWKLEDVFDRRRNLCWNHLVCATVILQNSQKSTTFSELSSASV